MSEEKSGEWWSQGNNSNTSGIPRTLKTGIYYSDKIEKLVKQIGTLKFVILIMAVALIFDSAKRIGLFGDYNITANNVSANTILLKGKDNKSYGKLSVEENSVSIFLLNDENQININPSNIEFLEIDDSTDKIILKIPKN